MRTGIVGSLPHPFCRRRDGRSPSLTLVAPLRRLLGRRHLPHPLPLRRRLSLCPSPSPYPSLSSSASLPPSLFSSPSTEPGSSSPSPPALSIYLSGITHSFSLFLCFSVSLSRSDFFYLSGLALSVSARSVFGLTLSGSKLR
ncbi:hypothetical protein ACLOJK_016346 [Asimina triloba]